MGDRVRRGLLSTEPEVFLLNDADCSLRWIFQMMAWGLKKFMILTVGGSTFEIICTLRTKEDAFPGPAQPVSAHGHALCLVSD